MSKSKYIDSLSESKNIFALEQKDVVLSFVKNVAFLLGHPVDDSNIQVYYIDRIEICSPAISVKKIQVCLVGPEIK